jgi:hypothetical protein
VNRNTDLGAGFFLRDMDFVTFVAFAHIGPPHPSDIAHALGSVEQ